MCSVQETPSTGGGGNECLLSIYMRHFDIFFTSAAAVADNEILSGLPGAAAVSLCGEEGREGKAANPSMSIAKMCHY